MVSAEACDPRAHERHERTGCRESRLARCHGETAAPTVGQISRSGRAKFASERVLQARRMAAANGSLLGLPTKKAAWNPNRGILGAAYRLSAGAARALLRDEWRIAVPTDLRPCQSRKCD